MRPGLVVVEAIILDNDSGFLEGVEQLTIEAFIPDLVMEAFNVAIFPWAARFDVQSLDVLGVKPVLYCIGHKLRHVIATHVFGSAILGNRFIQGHDDIVRAD